MNQYVREAKIKATEKEKYAIENGILSYRYVEKDLILVFRALYDCIHKSVVYYNCATHEFCKIMGRKES